MNNLTELEQYNHDKIVEHNSTLVSDEPIEYPDTKPTFSYASFMANRGKLNQEFFGKPHKDFSRAVDENYLNDPNF